MSQANSAEKIQRQDLTPPSRPQMAEVFGFQVPTNNYYLHRGHAWAVVEADWPGAGRIG